LPSTKPKKQLRLRVFAGPNGSGKSTVIKYVKNYKTNGKPVDFGHYINADQIAEALRKKSFSFNSFRFKTTNEEFQTIALASGLINDDLTEGAFKKCYSFHTNTISLIDKKQDERLAQIIADFLRKKLLALKERFSFETVFSHESKLDIMRQAKEAGYKVYLYFVSTESPEINKFRVEARTRQGGHDVPKDKIETRYYRSMNLLYEACQIAYQVFFFDNSVEGKDSVMFAHFKLLQDKKRWDEMEEDAIPNWFYTYYVNKI
jgi:predicted ABC-type ATPase